MRALLYAISFSTFVVCGGTIQSTTTVNVIGLSRDWMWVNTATNFDMNGDFSLPAGYKVWATTVNVFDASNALVSVITDSTFTTSVVSVSVPALSDVGQHCMTLFMQLGTFDNLNLFEIEALGGPQCFESAAYFSTISAVSIANGPPSGGTPVDFDFQLNYPLSVNSIEFDCVFGTLHAPLVYTAPSSYGLSTVTASCVSPSTPPDRFVCVQIVPRGAVFLLSDELQTDYACSDVSEFAFSYYAQMPVPISIDIPHMPYLGGDQVVVTGSNYPDAQSTSIIVIQVGSFAGLVCSSTSLTEITCPDFPSAAQAGNWTSPISISFNNGVDYSLYQVTVVYVPWSTIVSSVPEWGQYLDATPSTVNLTVEFTDPAIGGVPVTGPLNLCYYLVDPSGSTDLPDSLLPITWLEQSPVSVLQVELPTSPPLTGGVATVFLSLEQEDGICDWAGTFAYSYRSDWTVTTFGNAIVTGGAMSVNIGGSNLYQHDTESKCRLTAAWPESSDIATLVGSTCSVIGSMSAVDGTSAMCNFDLGLSFYECGYLAAQAATSQDPSELFLWDAVNLDLAIAMNGVDYVAEAPMFARAIRLPVIKAVMPSFGFNYGGFVIEIELQTGVAWEVERCLFTNTDTGVQRLVPASPFAIRTVVCIAPKWKLNSASVAFAISLLVDGTVFTAPVSFTMMQAPGVQYSSPREGPVSGYTRLSITGTYFDQIFVADNVIDLQCVFGLLPVPVLTPGLYVSPTVVECLTPPTSAAGYVPVTISVNWMSAGSNRLSTLALYQDVFHYLPAVVGLVSIWPLAGPRTGGTPVLLITNTPLLNNGLVRCSFGTVFVAADWQNSTAIVCISPASFMPGTVSLGISLDSQTVVPFEFANDTGNQTASSIGLAYFLFYHPPLVSSTSPQFGTVDGSTNILFRGAHFLNTTETACRFGTVVVPILQFVSSHAVVCVSPGGNLGDQELAVTNNGVDYIPGLSFVYTYVQAQPFLQMFPFMGPTSGGTSVIVTPTALNLPSGSIVSKPICTFGTYSVVGLVLDILTGVTQCVTPVVTDAGYYDVAVYYNGQDATTVAQKFYFYDLVTIDTVDPPLGPQGVTNTITLTGTNFINSEYLTVRFGTVNVGHQDVPGVWISETTIRAASPSTTPAIGLLRVPVMVSNNGVDYTPASIADWSPDDDLFDILGVVRYYTLHVPVILKLVNPSWANMHGGGFVSVHGGPFMNTGIMACGFDWIYRSDVSPVFVSASEILCPVPDMWAAGAGSSLTRTASLQVALVGTDWSDSFLNFEFLTISPPGAYTPHTDPATFTSNFVPCIVGHECPLAGLSAPLQCAPGSYQPSPGKQQCVVCPIGYYCPHVRMEAPALCPPGWVCDEDGLISPYKRCPAGFVCLEGTATFDPLPNAPLNGLSPSAETNAGYNAPYRCLQGMYCLEGVVAFASIPGNYSTPQPCYQGSYCKPGSGTPFGAGAIPLGRFSPSPQNPGILCPSRFACGPVTGSVEPHPCAAGSYNFYSGQHNCTLAHEGSIAPAPMQVRPTPTDCGHQGGRKGIFALSEIDLCPSATTCGYGVASNNEPKICFPVLTTDPVAIGLICKASAGQILWPANTFSNLTRVDPTVANCCWTNPIVVFFAEKIAEAYEQNPFGEGYEGKSARRWKQRIQSIHATMVANGDPAGFDGIQLIETVNRASLLTTFGVHCGRVRERIAYAIERYFSFKPPEFCAAGNFCIPGTCSAFPTVDDSLLSSR